MFNLDLTDPSMKEVIDEFSQETLSYCKDMKLILKKLKDEPTKVILLEQYAQIIDRVMGTAQTLGLDQMGSICSLCKLIGYKGSQSNDKKLNKKIANQLKSSVLLIERYTKDIVKNTSSIVNDEKYKNLIIKLNKTTNELKHIERGSVSSSGNEDVDIDALINQLG